MSRGLEWCFDALLAAMTARSEVALRHRFVTLMVMLATVAATAWLFIVIPKGFFPRAGYRPDSRRDRGGARISRRRGMAALQQRVIAAVLKDPGGRLDRARLSAPGGATSTENQGRVFIALKPSERAHADRCGDGAARPASRAACRRQALHAGGAGYQYRRPADRDAVPIHADGRRFGRAEPMGADGAARLAKLPQLIDVTSDQQSAGPQLEARDRPRAWLRGSASPRRDRRGAVRCLRAATDRAALYQRSTSTA